MSNVQKGARQKGARRLFGAALRPQKDDGHLFGMIMLRLSFLDER